MARFARAANTGSSIRGRCSIPIHTKHHHCPHRNSGHCQGGGNVWIEGKQAQREGDSVIFSGCQHGGIGRSIDGSNTVYINNRRAVRIKDEVACSTCSQRMYVVEGASTVFIGD